MRTTSQRMLTVTCTMTATSGLMALLTGLAMGGAVGAFMASVGAVLMLSAGLGIVKVAGWSPERRPGGGDR